METLVREIRDAIPNEPGRPSATPDDRRSTGRRSAGALRATLLVVDPGRRIGDSTFADIYQAFLDHLVIFIPNRRALSPEEHGDFARRFGEIDYEPFAYSFTTPTVVPTDTILLLTSARFCQYFLT